MDSSLSTKLREAPEETLNRLSSTLAIVCSIVAGTLLTVYLSPPETVRVGTSTKEWIGCCVQFPKGSCGKFVQALAAFELAACVLAFASLCFITVATIKTAGQPFRRSASPASVVADFVAAKWAFIGAVLLTFVVVLLYTPIAYSLTIFILSCSFFGLGLAFAVYFAWGHFWDDVRHDISLFRQHMKAPSSRRGPSAGSAGAGDGGVGQGLRWERSGNGSLGGGSDSKLRSEGSVEP